MIGTLQRYEGVDTDPQQLLEQSIEGELERKLHVNRQLFAMMEVVDASFDPDPEAEVQTTWFDTERKKLDTEKAELAGALLIDDHSDADALPAISVPEEWQENVGLEAVDVRIAGLTARLKRLHQHSQEQLAKNRERGNEGAAAEYDRWQAMRNEHDDGLSPDERAELDMLQESFYASTPPDTS